MGDACPGARWWELNFLGVTRRARHPAALFVMPLQGSGQSRDITFPDYTFWGHEYQYLQVGGGSRWVGGVHRGGWVRVLPVGRHLAPCHVLSASSTCLRPSW